MIASTPSWWKRRHWHRHGDDGWEFSCIICSRESMGWLEFLFIRMQKRREAFIVVDRLRWIGELQKSERSSEPGKGWMWRFGVDLRKEEEEEEEVVVAGLTGGGGKGVDVKVGFIRVAGAGGGNPPTFNPFRWRSPHWAEQFFDVD